jgi:hypothetical protein
MGIRSYNTGNINIKLIFSVEETYVTAKNFYVILGHALAGRQMCRF